MFDTCQRTPYFRFIYDDVRNRPKGKHIEATCFPNIERRKKRGVGKQPATGPDHLKRMIISHLRKLQKLPGLVSSFFGTPETVYAAI